MAGHSDRIDMAVAACVALAAATPQGYGDAFEKLAAAAGVIDPALATRLVKAAGFMARVHRAATSGPADLVRFLAALDSVLDEQQDAAEDDRSEPE